MNRMNGTKKLCGLCERKLKINKMENEKLITGHVKVK